MSTIQMLVGGATATLNSASAAYAPICGGRRLSWATENFRSQLAAFACTMGNLQVVLSGTPGVGKSYTFVVRQNSADTAISVAITGTATGGSDVVNTIQVVAGDALTLEETPASSPAPLIAQWSTTAEFGTPNRTILPCSGTTTNAASNPIYAPIQGLEFAITTTYGVSTIISGSGFLSDLYADTLTAPGVIAGGFEFAVFVNNVITALTTTVTGLLQTKNQNTDDTVSVKPGDFAYVRVATIGTVTTYDRAILGLVFRPDTDGEYLVCVNGGLANMSNSTTSRNFICAGVGAWATVAINSRNVPVQNARLKRMDALLSADPGAGANEYKFTVEHNSGLTGLTFSIVDGVVGTVSSNLDVTTGQVLDVRSDPLSSPTASNANLGFLFFATAAVSAVPATAIDQRSAIASGWEP